MNKKFLYSYDLKCFLGRIAGICLISLLLTGCQGDTGAVTSEGPEEGKEEISGEFYQKSVEFGSGELGLFFKEDETGEIKTIEGSDKCVHMTSNGAKVYYQIANTDEDTGEDLLDQDVVCYDAATEEKSVVVSGEELQKALTDNQLPTRSSGYLEEFHIDQDHLYMTISVEEEGDLYCHILNITLSGQNTIFYEKELSSWLEDTIEGSIALRECTYGFVQGSFVCEDWSVEPSRRYAYDLEKKEEIPVKKGTVWDDYLDEISPENQSEKDVESGKGAPKKDVEIEEGTLEKQLRVILAQEKEWKYDYREKDDWWYEGAERYYYMISDLDQNGRVEIICQTYQGNGHIPINDYFEVNEKMDGLDQITFESKTEDEDYADFGSWSTVYYEEGTGTYHYALGDWERGSAVDHSEAELDVILQKGKLTSNRYCSWDMVGDRDGKTGEQAEKCRLGWKYLFYDQKGRKISAREFFKLYYEDYFQSMTQRTAQFSWFQTIDEEAYEKDVSDIKNVSEEELYKKMRASYRAFGFTEKGKSAVEQIKLIDACREQWMPWKRESNDLEPEQFSFLVADMDANGQLELLVSFCGGSGNVSQNYYYEVNEDGDALVDITPEVEHETDWLGGSLDYRKPLMAVYQENTGGMYITHYSVSDVSWGGSGNGESISQDVYLLDQELHVIDFAADVSRNGKRSYYRIEGGVREKITKKQYRRLQKKHFEDLEGEVYPYDDGRIFYWFHLSDGMSEEELTRELENGFMNWFYNSDQRYKS